VKGKKVCIITGGRPDYSYLYWLMRQVEADHNLVLQVVATSMHLSKSHGLTYKKIIQDGFSIAAKVPVLNEDDSQMGMINAIAGGCPLFAKTFQKLKPDIVVVLGDRFEALAAAIAAYILKIPIAHIHGGEVTAGAIDEGFRHSITKMAALHFTAACEYRNRVIQLGENPKRVFNCGTLSLEAIANDKILSRSELLSGLRVEFDDHPLAIATYHPETLDGESAVKRLRCIFRAIKKTKVNVVFTKANSDAQGDRVNGAIADFCAKNSSKYILFDFLGRQRYFSCLAHFDLMIGNSSSGIIEAPSFKLPVVNIGDRQSGRICSENIINTDYDESRIISAINKASLQSFKMSLKDMQNVYMPGKSCVSKQITNILKKEFEFLKKFKKEFYDLSG